MTVNNPPSSDAIDFINDPDLRVRDLSYSASRTRQLVDLTKGSFFDMGFGPQPEDAVHLRGDVDWPNDRIETYIKHQPRGPGYVCDVVYRSDDLPFVVYAVLINRGHGLEVAELELFRRDWGCFDGHDNYLHPDQQDPVDPHDPPTLITSDALRRIPLGDILARVQRELPDDSWRTTGIRQVPDDSVLVPEQLTETERRSLENASRLPTRKRGRPELTDELLIEVANAYIHESSQGRGAVGRVAQAFDRPDPTIRDWIAAARKRGYLAPTTPGRRSAVPGPNLPRETAFLAAPNLTRERRRTVLRLIEGERVLDANLPEDSLLLFVVSGLVCNDVGAAKMDTLHAAMNNPQVLEAAMEILNKARRRRAAADSPASRDIVTEAHGTQATHNPLFRT